MKLRAQISQSRSFTLVELLTVLAIMTILAILVVPGLQSAFGTAFGSEASDIASTLMRARAYAIANNTYGYVGLTEVSAGNSSTTSPQTAGYGRIAVVVYATSDGSRGYDPTTNTASPTTPVALPQTSATPFTNTSLIVVSPLHHFDNIHMVPLPTTATAVVALFGSSYPISSPTLLKYNSFFDLAVSTGTTIISQSALTMTWPTSGTAQYTFGGTNSGSIIQFNPQGEAQIFTGPNTDPYYQWIEMDLAPSHGATTNSTPNQRSILIDGASGAVSIYRS